MQLTRSDRAKLVANPKVKEWWKLTDLCQQPLFDRFQGEWWAAMQQAFHQD